MPWNFLEKRSLHPSFNEKQFRTQVRIASHFQDGCGGTNDIANQKKQIALLENSSTDCTRNIKRTKAEETAYGEHAFELNAIWHRLIRLSVQ